MFYFFDKYFIFSSFDKWRLPEVQRYAYEEATFLKRGRYMKRFGVLRCSLVQMVFRQNSIIVGIPYLLSLIYYISNPFLHTLKPIFHLLYSVFFFSHTFKQLRIKNISQFRKFSNVYINWKLLSLKVMCFQNSVHGDTIGKNDVTKSNYLYSFHLSPILNGL